MKLPPCRRAPLFGPLLPWLAGVSDPRVFHGTLLAVNEQLDAGFACSLSFAPDLLERQAWIIEAAYRQGVRRT